MRDTRPIVKFDTETKCKLSLPDVGRHRYLSHPTADILMFGYKLGSVPTELWLPGMPVPIFFRNPKDFRFAAFNAQFDWMVMNKFAKRYGWGELTLEQMVDVMAVAARYGLPQSLDKLGFMLNVKLIKMSIGTQLKKVCCTVPPTATPDQDLMFQKYCVRDVDSMTEIMAKMPSDCLSDNEQDIWVRTAEVNNRGVPVDTWSVKQINKVVDHYTEKQAARVPFLTGGAIKTVNQGKAIIAWCGSKDIFLPNFQKLTVDALVDKMRKESETDPLGTEHQKVYDLLRVRQLIGGAAVKKFKRLLNMAVNGRIHDNLRYHGAGTGRTTGGGFQMLNLPRAKVKAGPGETYDEAVESVLRTFFDVSVLAHPDPLEQAKKLVRPMLKARKNKTLMVADWASIEYILLMYFAGEWEKVQKFREGLDPYITFATELYHVAYEDVEGWMRQNSKPPVLGSGYMLSSGGLIGYAEGYGVDMTKEQAVFATNTYRNGHPRVVKSWHELKRCAHNAVKNFGTEYIAKIRSFDEGWTHDLRTKFVCTRDRSKRPWLIMTIPSGRSLFYCMPQIIQGKYGEEIAHRGINPKTKQWGTVYLRPQRIIENIIQGLGRDILTNGMERLDKAGYTRVFDVYDEIGCEEDVVGAEQKLKEMEQLMCVPPTWMPNLPLKADGYVSQRYMKG